VLMIKDKSCLIYCIYMYNLCSPRLGTIWFHVMRSLMGSLLVKGTMVPRCGTCTVRVIAIIKKSKNSPRHFGYLPGHAKMTFSEEHNPGF